MAGAWGHVADRAHQDVRDQRRLLHAAELERLTGDADQRDCRCAGAGDEIRWMAAWRGARGRAMVLHGVLRQQLLEYTDVYRVGRRDASDHLVGGDRLDGRQSDSVRHPEYERVHDGLRSRRVLGWVHSLLAA